MTVVSDLPIAKAILERSVIHNGWDVHVLAASGPNTIDVLHPISPPVIQRVAAGEFVERVPAFRLPYDSAQVLMDAMWNAGLRPTTTNGDATGMAAVIEAQKDHIADLRRIAFPTLQPDKPNSREAQF